VLPHAGTGWANSDCVRNAFPYCGLKLAPFEFTFTVPTDTLVWIYVVLQDVQTGKELGLVYDVPHRRFSPEQGKGRDPSHH